MSQRNESSPFPKLFVLTENIFAATVVSVCLFYPQGLFTGKYMKVPTLTIGTKIYLKACILPYSVI